MCFSVDGPTWMIVWHYDATLSVTVCMTILTLPNEKHIVVTHSQWLLFIWPPKVQNIVCAIWKILQGGHETV